nr:hypothetical protein [uncultured Flavobacterium sp.]
MENNLQSSNKAERKGIASLALGISAICLFFIPYCSIVAIPLGILSIIFGTIGFSQAKKLNVSTSTPKAGLMVGISVTAFILVRLLVLIGFMAVEHVHRKDDMIEKIKSIEAEKRKSDSLKMVKDTVKG